MMAKRKYPKIHLERAVRILLAPLGRYRGKGPTTHGMSSRPLMRIWIDPRRKELLGTLVHELYHIQHPDWSEAQVERAEEEWLDHASWKEKAKALQLLSRAKVATPAEYP